MNNFAKIILPLRFSRYIYYKIPSSIQDKVTLGSRVVVIFANRNYTGIVWEITATADIESHKIREITSIIESMPPVSTEELRFWEWISSYYMCTIGEVYKAAIHPAIHTIKENIRSLSIKKKTRNTKKSAVIELSNAQKAALIDIKEAIKKKNTVLLKGVTGSGKTEIYTTLAQETLTKGKSVLYLVPEITMSRQLQHRLEQYFGEEIVVYHSKKTIRERIDIYNRLNIRQEEKPLLIFGTRSAIFLPLHNLGLIIIDEEHDSSYKQTDPAPRYSAKDCALVLAKQHNSGVILGSATPSFESLYNAYNNKFHLVELTERYHHAPDPQITIVDMITERKRKRVLEELSLTLIERITSVLSNNEQVLVIRNSGSYSPWVQCNSCGFIPKCKKCNVSLSYHKAKQRLICNYCGHTEPYSRHCPQCGKDELMGRGNGTEKIEESLKNIFPYARIARFDQETISSKEREKQILKEFSENKIDIMIGTQMLSKGLDFENLSLAAIIDSDSLLAGEDFRTSEKAYQLLRQLAGRTGRKSKQGEIIIQTQKADHPIYKHILNNDEVALSILDERREFNYPPFSRIIIIEIRCSDKNKLADISLIAKKMSEKWNMPEIYGPFDAAGKRSQGKFSSKFLIKANRDNNLSKHKALIWNDLKKLEGQYPSITTICIVDPV